jgi:hypothetical protein
MGLLDRLLECVGLVILLCVTGLGQTDGASPAALASDGARIAGIVSVDGKPASGIVLMLYAPDNNGPLASTFNMGRAIGKIRSRAVTDSQGKYAFNGLTGAKYVVVPFGPTLAVPPGPGGLMAPGKSLSVDAGESVDGIDFSMSRGGVITGRVTRPDGRPAVEVQLEINQVDQSGIPLDMATGKFRESPQTDDRGIYRVFGLNPGRYAVCAQPSEGLETSSQSNVCYPGNTGETHSGVVTVGAGEEIRNIDITLGSPSATYEAVGRAVDDGGQPVSGAIYTCSPVSDDGSRMGASYMMSNRTDENGEFRMQGLARGRYAASLFFDRPSTYYSDASNFEITDVNVSGIQVKVHTGATIAGSVTVDGNQDPQVLAQLPNIGLWIHSYDAGSSPFGSSKSVNPAADGSFQATGLQPGTANFGISPSSGPSGFSLIRVELGGVPQAAGITVSAGQQITGVNLVLTYGTGVLRGQVSVVGGTLPNGTVIRAGAQLISDGSTGPSHYAATDARGRFEIDGLSDGQYQISVDWYGNSGRGAPQQKQIVTVNGGQAPETNVILSLAK